MSPKIVNKQVQKRMIAGAALRVFASKGFEQTTVSDVARAAGIGKGSVYEYFRSKEELIAAAADFWTDSVEERIREQLARIADPVEKLRKLVDLTFEQGSDAEHAELMGGAFAGLIASGHEDLLRKGVLEEHYRETGELIRGILLEGVASGAFRKEVGDNMESWVTNIHVYIDGLGYNYQYMVGERAKLRRQSRHFIESLLAMLRPPARGTAG
jgi:TetR/AcrR family fatty acid metabolism transcriptional regulator